MVFLGCGAYVASAGSYCFYSLAVFQPFGLFEALCWSWCAPLLRAEAGSRPGGRGTFLCFAKETYPKERRPCCLRPLRFAAGQPGVLVRGVRRGTHFAALQLRSDNHGESVDEAGVSCGTPATPRPARPRRIQKGLSTKTASRAIAALGLALRGAKRLRPSGPSAATARVAVGLLGCWAAHTLLAAPAAGRLGGEHGRLRAHAS